MASISSDSKLAIDESKADATTPPGDVFVAPVGSVSSMNAAAAGSAVPALTVGAVGPTNGPSRFVVDTQVDEESLDLMKAFHSHQRKRQNDFDALICHLIMRIQALETTVGQPAPAHSDITVYDRIEHLDSRLANMAFNVSGKADDSTKSLPRTARSARSRRSVPSVAPLPPRAPTPSSSAKAATAAKAATVAPAAAAATAAPAAAPATAAATASSPQARPVDGPAASEAKSDAPPARAPSPRPTRSPSLRPPTPQHPVDVRARARSRWAWAIEQVQFLLRVKHLGVTQRRYPNPNLSLMRRVDYLEAQLNAAPARSPAPMHVATPAAVPAAAAVPASTPQVESNAGTTSPSDAAAAEPSAPPAAEERRPSAPAAVSSPATTSTPSTGGISEAYVHIEIEKRVAETESHIQSRLASLQDENARLRDALTACGKQIAALTDMMGASQAETAQALTAAMAGTAADAAAPSSAVAAEAAAESAGRHAFQAPAHTHGYGASSVSGVAVASALRHVTHMVRQQASLAAHAATEAGGGKVPDFCPELVAANPDSVATMQQAAEGSDDALLATIGDATARVSRHLATWPDAGDMGDDEKASGDGTGAACGDDTATLRRLRTCISNALHMAKEAAAEVRADRQRQRDAAAASDAEAVPGGDDSTTPSAGAEAEAEVSDSKDGGAGSDAGLGRVPVAAARRRDRRQVEQWGWTWSSGRCIGILENLVRQVQDALAAPWPSPSLMVAVNGDRLVEDEWGKEVPPDAQVIKTAILRRLEELLEAAERALLVRSVSEMGATVCLAIGDAAAERYLSDKRNSIKLAGVVGHSNKVEARVSKELATMKESVSQAGDLTHKTSTTVESVMRELAQTHSEVRQLNDGLQGRATKEDLEQALQRVNDSIDDLEAKNRKGRESQLTQEAVEKLVEEKSAPTTQALHGRLANLNDLVSGKAEMGELKKLQTALRAVLKRVKLAEIAALENRQDPMLADKFRCLSCNRPMAAALANEGEPTSPTKTMFSASTQPPLTRHAQTPPPRSPPTGGRPNEPIPEHGDAPTQPRASTSGRRTRSGTSTRAGSNRRVLGRSGTAGARMWAEPAPAGTAFENLDLGGKQLRRNVSQSWREPGGAPTLPGAGASAGATGEGPEQTAVQQPQQQHVVVAYQRMMPRKVLRAKSSRSASQL